MRATVSHRAISPCVLVPILVALAGAVRAEVGFDPAARARFVAPFIDNQTVGVAHIDLTRVEVDPLVDEIIELEPGSQYQLSELREPLKRVHEAFRQASFHELFVVVSSADLPTRPPFVVAPMGKGGDVDALRKRLPPPGPNEVVERLDGVLFAGYRQTLERVKGLTPDARPELAAAFEAAGDTAAQFLLLPPDYARRVVEEMVPTLPERMGGGPSTILTRGMRWAAVGVNAPPNPSLRIVIQSEDPQAAAALRSTWLAWVESLSREEGTEAVLRLFSKAAALLTPDVEGARLVLDLRQEERAVEALIAALRPPFEEIRRRAQRERTSNDLKHLGLAMHNYHDANKALPPVGSRSPEGKLLLSWRVHILPYVEEQRLYEQFHLDEPWDSEHNRTLIPKMPGVFCCPASKLSPEQGLATYRVVSSEETAFPPKGAITSKDIKDGTSWTIMAVEVDDEHAVVWTKPEGLPFDPEHPSRGLGGHFEGGFWAALCDGAAKFVEQPIEPDVLRALFTRAGGEAIPRF